jgi:hypothetical protein
MRPAGVERELAFGVPFVVGSGRALPRAAATFAAAGADAGGVDDFAPEHPATIGAIAIAKASTLVREFAIIG